MIAPDIADHQARVTRFPSASWVAADLTRSHSFDRQNPLLGSKKRTART
jgi:hypothetical protein